MSKIKSIIRTSVGAKSLVIENTATGSKLVIEVDGKGVKTSKEALAGKEDQYGSYINKFVKELVTTRLPKSLSYKERFKRISKVVETIDQATTFRLLSNQLRRKFDDGKLYPKGSYFYEGMKKAEDTK